MSKRSRGRPKLNPGEKRSKMIRVMATPEQCALMTEAAEQKDKSLSTWLLEVGVRSARRQLKDG